jgi:hypothetical protein
MSNWQAGICLMRQYNLTPNCVLNAGLYNAHTPNTSWYSLMINNPVVLISQVSLRLYWIYPYNIRVFWLTSLIHRSSIWHRRLRHYNINIWPQLYCNNRHYLKHMTLSHNASSDSPWFSDGVVVTWDGASPLAGAKAEEALQCSFFRGEMDMLLNQVVIK